MRSAFLTVGLLMFLSLACSGPSAPTAPSTPTADLPSWVINVDGSDYEVGPGDLLSDRYAAAVEPGTDMTPDELRIYFAVNITKANFPRFLWCLVYKYYIYPVMLAQPDEEVLRWVEVMEGNGYDVPNAPPPPPIC